MAKDVTPSPSGRHPAAQTRISVAGNFKLDRGIIVLITIAMAALMLAIPAATAFAQTLDLPAMKVEGRATIGGPTASKNAADPCVGVDVAGRKAGSEACAAQKLQDAAKAAQEHTGQGRDTADIPAAAAHDTKIGLASQTATKQRLGNNFGKSVLPQRPNAPPPPPTPFARQN
jgi:hypothetical protein